MKRMTTTTSPPRQVPVRGYAPDLDAVTSTAAAAQQPIGVTLAQILLTAAQRDVPPRPLPAPLPATVYRRAAPVHPAAWASTVQTWRRRYGMTWPQAIHTAVQVAVQAEVTP